MAPPALRALRRSLLPMALAGCLAAPAAASPKSRDAFPLIAQAMRAKLACAYTARQDIIFTSCSPGAAPTQIVADIARDGRRSHMTYRSPQTVAGLEIFDDGVHIRQYEPRRHVLLVGRSQAAQGADAVPRDMLALLHHNYVCLRLRRESLNNRTCDVVALRPRYYRSPSRLCWVDRASHLILRTEEYDASGYRLYVSSFETIRIVPRLSARAFTLPAAARNLPEAALPLPVKAAPSARQAFAAAGIPGHLPAWCPRGYRQVGAAVLEKRPASRAAVLRYSDGLKTISVFEEPVTAALPGASSQQRMLNRHLGRYGQQAWVREGAGIRITAIGDLTLSPDLGAELMAALSPQADSCLARGLARSFGSAAAQRGPKLRRDGWGYDQIAALFLYWRSHPQRAARLRALLARRRAWPTIAQDVHADAAVLEGQARRWVSATLRSRQGRKRPPS